MTSRLNRFNRFQQANAKDPKPVSEAAWRRRLAKQYGVDADRITFEWVTDFEIHFSLDGRLILCENAHVVRKTKLLS
jgi:hypothetical protein